MSQHVSDSPAGPRLARVSPSRRSLLLGAAAVAPLVALGAGTAHGMGEFHDAGGLRMVDHWVHDEIRSVDFRVDTGGMVKTFDPSLRVTVPPSYAEKPDARYPVLVLLHGRGGFYQDWTNQGNVVEQTEEHEVIVVSPDGGAGSFYSNANFPILGREAAWESFIMEQMLPFVHANFRTDPERMAIGGLSMGGWGALSLGQRYWGHFRSVSSYSGPADCSNRSDHARLVRATIWICPVFDKDKYPLTANLPGATWGTDWDRRLATSYNPSENIDRFRDKRVFLRTGDGGWDDVLGAIKERPDLLGTFLAELDEHGMDFIESVVHHTQEDFSAELTSAGIEHDYELIPGATHDWDLWKANLAEDLPGMMKVLSS
ncbi:MAG: esterase family protein [Actinomycetales bacterium]|nr:esterase family protein [Actinomycetales bacterium]